MNNPLRYTDPDGRTEEERKKAIETTKSLENTPYKQIDCSALVNKGIKAAGLGNFNTGDQNGVGNIASHSREVSRNQIREGDFITMRSGRSDHKGPDGKFDHMGFVTKVEHNQEGDVVSMDIIHSSVSKGVTIKEKIQGNSFPGFEITGYYQWDTPETSSSGNSEGNFQTPGAMSIRAIDSMPEKKLSQKMVGTGNKFLKLTGAMLDSFGY